MRPESDVTTRNLSTIADSFPKEFFTILLSFTATDEGTVSKYVINIFIDISRFAVGLETLSIL